MRKPTNKSYVCFDEVSSIDIGSAGLNYMCSFNFLLSLQGHMCRIAINEGGDDGHSLNCEKRTFARLLNELKNRKHIPKKSPTHYVESGCAWAATKRT